MQHFTSSTWKTAFKINSILPPPNRPLLSIWSANLVHTRVTCSIFLMQAFQEHPGFKSSILKGHTHKSCIRSACHISTHARDVNSVPLEQALYISTHLNTKAVFQWANPDRHRNIEAKLHNEYLQQNPINAPTKTIKCQKYNAAFGISGTIWRNSNTQVEKLKSQQSLLPQHFSYPANHQVLTMTCKYPYFSH